MREIKFRAWDDLNKVMHYNVGFLSGIWYRGTFLSDNFEVLGAEPMINPMQYTGLKDKNGKEIYEGDVVHRRTTADNYKEKWDTEHTYTVIYDEEKAKFRLKEESDCWGMIWKMEVIGNIYQDSHHETRTNRLRAQPKVQMVEWRGEVHTQTVQH